MRFYVISCVSFVRVCSAERDTTAIISILQSDRCRPIQFMHTCLIISLHGVLVFFVIIECAYKYMCICNNGKNSKLRNARGTTVRYHGCVVSVVL